MSNYHVNSSHWWLVYLLWNCHQMNVTGFYWLDKSTLVQVMAWCRHATSHHLSQYWIRSMSPYGVIRPQWVLNTMPHFGVYNVQHSSLLQVSERRETVYNSVGVSRTFVGVLFFFQSFTISSWCVKPDHFKWNTFPFFILYWLCENTCLHMQTSFAHMIIIWWERFRRYEVGKFWLCLWLSCLYDCLVYMRFSSTQ